MSDSSSTLDHSGKPEPGDRFQFQNQAEKGWHDNDASISNGPPTTTAGAPPANAELPDGGWKAWLQVAGAFMVFFNTWGLLNTFGVYQTYYESGTMFQESSSNISWIGSIQSFFVLLGGMVSGPLYDKGYLKHLLMVGAFGIVFGHMMLSLSKTFWEALLAQGFCIGLGAGLIFSPALSVLPTYFRNRLGLASGLAASGSSFGGIIYPIAFYQLIEQDNIGFPWSVRILGFISLATILLPIAVLEPRVKPKQTRAAVDWSNFKDMPFVVLLCSVVLGMSGLYVLLFYFSYYGQATGIVDAKMAFYIVPILNVGSMFGRTLPNWLSDKTGPLNLMVPGAIINAILAFCVIRCTDLAGYVIIALFFGFSSGIFIALPPVLMARMTADKSKIGTRFGMGFAVLGASVFIGGPASGAVLDRVQPDGQLSWHSLWIFSGVLFAASAIVMGVLRVWVLGPKLRVKG